MIFAVVINRVNIKTLYTHQRLLHTTLFAYVFCFVRTDAQNQLNRRDSAGIYIPALFALATYAE